MANNHENDSSESERLGIFITTGFVSIWVFFSKEHYAIEHFPYPFFFVVFSIVLITLLILTFKKIMTISDFITAVAGFTFMCYLMGSLFWYIEGDRWIVSSIEYQKKSEQKAYLSTPIGTLETRLHEIKDLKKDLYFKWEQIGKVLPEFEKEISDLNSTIISYKNKNGIRTYEEAKRHRTINESLEHIQRKQAYVDELKKVHSRISSGWNQADFLEKKTTDDLKLMHALGDQNTKDLVKKIASLFKEFQPYTGELVIEGKNTKPLKTIWDEINR